jgi:hypothetical protein
MCPGSCFSQLDNVSRFLILSANTIKTVYLTFNNNHINNNHPESFTRSYHITIKSNGPSIIKGDAEMVYAIAFDKFKEGFVYKP